MRSTTQLWHSYICRFLRRSRFRPVGSKPTRSVGENPAVHGHGGNLHGQGGFGSLEGDLIGGTVDG